MLTPEKNVPSHYKPKNVLHRNRAIRNHYILINCTSPVLMADEWVVSWEIEMGVGGCSTLSDQKSPLFTMSTIHMAIAAVAPLRPSWCSPSRVK